MCARRIPFFWGLALTLAATGCQHVPPQPLDLGTTRVELAARQPDVEQVRTFAAKLLGNTTADSAVFDPADGLSLREAEAVALWYNTDLRVSRLELQQAEATADAAGKWDDPAFSLDLGEKEVESGSDGFLHDAADATRSWISAPSLSITLPLSGRKSVEKRIASTEASLVLVRVEQVELATRRHLHEAWARWTEAVERERLLDAHLALLTQFSATAESLAASGEVLASSARLFTIEQTRKQAERAQLAARVKELHAQLLHLMGLLPDAPVTLRSEFDTHAEMSDADDGALLEHPMVRLASAEYDLAEAQLRLEVRKQYPDLTLSPTYTDEEDETSLVVGMGMPLPVWNANREGIADAKGAREVARARVEAAILEVSAEAAQARQALQGARERRIRIMNEVAPAIDTQVSEALALLQLGEVEFVLIYEALAQALEAKLELLNVTLDEALAAARLDAALATHTPLATLESENTP